MRSSVTWLRSRIQQYLHPIRHYKWSSKAEFIVSSIGYCIGFGTLWRFPYVAHKNGGGAFILSYTICMMFISVPMFYLECALGQFTGCNAIAAFNFAPVCKGIGFAMTLVPFYVCLYYAMILVYSLKFMMVSFSRQLPWEICNLTSAANSTCDNKTLAQWPTNTTQSELVNTDCHNDTMSCTERYWLKEILHYDDGSGKMYSLEDVGVVQWDLFLALMVCWLIQYIVISRGIRSIAKAAYFTCAFSFVVIICMVVNALYLNNSTAGLEYLFIPKLAKLASLEMWVDSISHSFFSTGICFGCIILYSSYNKFHTELSQSVFFILLVGYGANILSAVTVFSVLGYLSEKLGVDIEEVVKAGPGIIFIVMPEAVSKLPVPQFWCFLYFLTVFTMGIDSQAAQLDSFITSIYEQLPRLKHYIVSIRMIICFILFMLSIPFTTNAGELLIGYIDNFVINLALIFVAICEVVSLMYIYGWANFFKDIEFMENHRIHWFLKFSWRFLCPFLLLVALILGIVFDNSCEEYSTFFCIGGWFISLSIISQVSIVGIFVLVKYYRESSVKEAFKPIYTWGPRDVINKVMYLEWQKGRGVELGVHTITGLEELAAEGPDLKTEVESRLKQRKYSVFYKFSNVFLPDELEEMERGPEDEPSTSR